MVDKHWFIRSLVTLFTWSSLSAQHHAVNVYQSGIRFESKQYPDHFLGFNENDLVSTNKSSALGILSDPVASNKTLWYIEEKPGCHSNDVKGYFIRSLAFAQFYITTNNSSCYLSRTARHLHVLHSFIMLPINQEHGTLPLSCCRKLLLTRF